MPPHPINLIRLDISQHLLTQMANRVTIKDIAKVANCSVNCVSRALMDAPDISTETKSRIKEIANTMGYVRNSHAATLRNGTSHTIGILFDSLLNPFYYVMTNYIWELLISEDYKFITFKNDSPIFDVDMARRIASSNVDGILSFLQPTKEAQDILDKLRIPLVVLGRKTDICDCVVLDDYAGGKAAAENFISRGFTHPIYMGEPEYLECSKNRALGFKETLERANISVKTYMIDDMNLYKYAHCLETLYNDGVEMDCVFCFSDYAAYEVLSERDRLGIKNLAIIGFDNIQNEIFMPGTLTTVAYDKKKMAQTAVDLLLKKIASQQVSNESNVYLIDDLHVVSLLK